MAVKSIFNLFHLAEEVGVFAGMEDETTQYIELFTEPDGGKKRSPRVVTNEANLNTAARDNEEVHTENNEGIFHVVGFYQNAYVSAYLENLVSYHQVPKVP